MKKLMFMIAAVAMAASLQAASLQWGIDKCAFMLSDGASRPNGLTVYLLDTGAEGYSLFKTSLADGSINAGNVASKFSSYSGLLMDTQVTKSSDNTTSTSMSKNYAYVATQTIGTDDTAKHYYTVLAFDTNGDYLLSGTVEGVGYEGTDPSAGKMAKFASAAFADDWNTPSGVPEPTSGLLLVLGGAMLALRRRRA